MIDTGKAALLLFCSIYIPAILVAGGCSKKKPGTTPASDEQQTGAGSEKASPAANTIQHISDNPRFFKVTDQAPSSESARDLDSIIRPILTKLCGGAKLVAESGKDTTTLGREDVLNSMTYVVRRLLDKKDGDDLHAALLAAHFTKSPRYGSKPQHGRTKIIMSLFITVETRPYSLGIQLDLTSQSIRVDSFQLGSKYDRL